MTNAVTEIGSLFIDVFWKVLTLSMFLFTSSMIMKYNYYQRTNFIFVVVIIFFNLFAGMGITMFWWYLLGGLRGHFIPRGMPAFPYLYTEPRINNINYLITPQGCDSKDFPKIPEDKMNYKYYPRKSIFYDRSIGLVLSPAGNTEDTDIFNTNPNGGNENARVDKLIFGVRSGHTNPCDRSYLGLYRLNSWE